MNIPHERFCVLPWVSLEASPIGTVRPCCLADDEITDDNGEKFQLSSARFTDIQNSQHMRSLREEFLAGQQPQTCRRCWNEERAGRTSKRMHTLNRLRGMIDDQPWTADARPLMFLDLKLGNICNLKCRICGSWSSSQYATEELNWLRPEERKTSYPYQMLRAGAWPRENTEFWHEIDEVVDQIRYIEFTGGEPFMIREHFQLLQGLVDRGIAGGVEIHYNTNGTQWPEEAEEIWQHFKTVEIAFSIDDLGERFEYQRTNAVWTEVEHNIQRYRDLRSRCSNIQLQVCCTINVFNIWHLHETAEWIYAQNFDFVYWNMMHDPFYFSVATVPAQVKAVITERFNTLRTRPEYQAEFDRIIEFMNRGATMDGFMLAMKIRDLDRKRSQNLARVDPEFAAVLDYDYDKN
jgi:MoaA/NifB/PqqE/SkfB family radical SAM enzyme